MTLIQARVHEHLSCLGIPAMHRSRYLSQFSGLALECVEAMLSGSMADTDMGTSDLEALATALEVPGWWLVLPFEAVPLISATIFI